MTRFTESPDEMSDSDDNMPTLIPDPRDANQEFAMEVDREIQPRFSPEILANLLLASARQAPSAALIRLGTTFQLEGNAVSTPTAAATGTNTQLTLRDLIQIAYPQRSSVEEQD